MSCATIVLIIGIPTGALSLGRHLNHADRGGGRRAHDRVRGAGASDTPSSPLAQGHALSRSAAAAGRLHGPDDAQVE
jgi:hypothetical protein